MSVTLTVSNNFAATVKNAADYFGSHFGDDEVWLYFLNTGGNISYTDATSGASASVSDTVAIQLSSVKGGVFSLATVENSTKLFAGLGATNPFSGSNGPGIFDDNVPYALAEWTINGNQYDNIDVSYIDSFSFPTTLTVTDATGAAAGKAGFKPGTTAASLLSALKSRMPNAPVGPDNDNYPASGQVGYGPLVPTLASNPQANRWIGSSKYYISGPDGNNLRSMYLYAPSFGDYLGYLQSNEPTTELTIPASAPDVMPVQRKISGWFIDYSGNGGYSGYLSITGDAQSGYGLHIHDLRINTGPSAANGWKADPHAGEAISGDIRVAANGAVVAFDTTTQVTGNWSDAVIYSGAAIIDTLGGGPVVTASGDLADGAPYNAIVATMLASISAGMATGLLGSSLYTTAYQNANDPKSTMYWFNTLSRADATTQLFDHAWPNGQQYYDPFWALMAEQTDNQGYLSPFNDRWSNFSPDFSLAPGYQIQWQLGLLASS